VIKKGVTFNIQRFSTEDGPGIRTTVFMKGCNLKCLWCHNPEGINKSPELVWYDTKCIGARECLSACEEDALNLTSKGMQINRERCTGCGKCESACPAAALEIIGKYWTVEDLLKEVEKDKAFYNKSGGGITISGGEPLTQREFLLEFLKECKRESLHIALDTCGYTSSSQLKEILPYLDLVLYDLKQIEREKHYAATGVYPDVIFENAEFLSSHHIPMWIRTPIIPGYTDKESNIAGIAQFIAQRLSSVQRYDLLSFTKMCVSKYERLGKEFSLSNAELVTSKRMEELKEVAQSKGVKNVVWSGLTKNETAKDKEQ